MTDQPIGKFVIVKTIYFYLVSFVALMMVVFSVADVINAALKTWVFTKADNYNNYYVEPACDALTIKSDAAIKPLTTEECDQRKAEADKRAIEERTAQRQRDIVRDISMIVVGVPLFATHWWIIRKKENI